MGTMTLRGIDETISNALKEKARLEDSSINTVILRMIKESLGIEKKNRTFIHNDLDYLAGTWSEKDASEFDRAVSVFEKVDVDMWKTSR